MKSFLLLFSIFISCNFSWAQTAEEKAVNGVFISYIKDDGKACNKCYKALQSYPNNQKLLNFKKLYCSLTPPTVPLTINLSKTNVSSSGGSDGTANANVSGGKPPYQYSWSNGNNGSKLTNLTAGTYTVTVSDNVGETKKASVTISAPNSPPPPPALALKLTFTHSNVSAAGKSDGTAKASVSGGNSPYQYDWSNGDTGSKITNLAPGTYKVTVTDNSGKTKTGSVTISDKKPESINVNLRETSQNKFAWSSKLSEKGASVKLKISSQGISSFTVDVSNQSSYTFSTGNAKWDGVPCTVELIIVSQNGITLSGKTKIETFCACKP
jgi:hypothetical protein